MPSNGSDAGSAAAARGELSGIDDRLADHSRMSFLEHLDELRRRIIYSVLAIAGCLLVTSVFWERMFRFLVEYFQIQGVTLIYTQPIDGFMFAMKICIIAAVFLASPFVFAQVWFFVAPGLYKREKRMVLPFVVSSTTLFASGAAFAHFVAFPAMWKFFGSFAIHGVKYYPTLDSAFALYWKMLAGLGAVFQLPMLVFVLAKFGIVTAGFLWRNTKYAILIFFIIAAIVTPTPDPVNQTIFATPMVLLYLVSIGVAWVFGKKSPKKV